MREFITREIGRLLRGDEFANDFVAEAERMIVGIRSMLPHRDKVERGTDPADTAGTLAQELTGTLVVARVATAEPDAEGDGLREIIGILRGGRGDRRVYGIPVDSSDMRPLTREDADRMLGILEESDLSWPEPAAEGPA
ncbi:MAG: hypothetical protein GVY29_06255 [Spirochaetes bacterium]|nr:hypothetical protein [Spirochaetota bacterium]